ncbi:uncharacterized protein F4807DRAFT_460805 [Annulohypoxylon truncatum]|uniref:uncharacterized protein n=1 Tax=Annulohypoxylon truncatum TaxID=327061 RepID=UPI0020088DDF|nr:uncharacterized protein F4807DRAFT_460805 [Annulohypoxylon truncatum]KAI1209585.1 hypothetical protein F4807DRAFT_460805 [Annulohypoxylon truncatum]
MSFKQQNTGKSARKNAGSQKRSESFKIQAEREAAQPKRCQESVSAYAGLTWELLESFLLGKWPNEDFKGKKIHDSWVFEAPGRLTEEDRRTIRRLRDNSMAQSDGRRRSITPE